MNHVTHNANLRRRHERLAQRRHRSVTLRRRYLEHMPAVEQCDAIMGVGNQFILDTWGTMFDRPTYGVNNFGFRETVFRPQVKDYGLARRHFLFFASRSQVQKGLDLLLEIFPRLPSLHLYVCSDFEAEHDFCACYHRELYETPNVHPVGWVQVGSPAFYELVAKCACVIHPTCSEGQAGSVTQCMYAGLVPLVTREAGIDTEDFGVTFADDSLEEIERTVLDVAHRPAEWHREHSLRTRQVAEQHYSEEAFRRRWRDIIVEVTQEQAARRG